MFSGSKKPYSSISVHVERLTTESYDEDDLAGIPDLIEVVKLQATGSTEVARALRKKLKYGSVHRQLRALTILDGLVQNAGSRFQRTIFSDEPLLERLRISATDSVSDPEVKTKCKVLFGQWAAGSKSEPGLEGAAALYKQLPRTRKPQVDRREQSKVLRETEEQAGRDEATEEEPRRLSVGPSSPRSSVSRASSGPALLTSGPNLVTKTKKSSKKNKSKLFNLDREKPALLQTIASSQVASTNLTNALKLVNRESHRVSDDPEVMKHFETCKQLRRQILRYIQYVESDDFLGGLIHANEELVTALMAFEVLDKSVDDDSDSEMEEAAHLSRAAALAERSGGSPPAPPRGATESMAGLSLQSPKMPHRPGVGAMVAPQSELRAMAGRGKTTRQGSDSESENDDDDDDDDEDNPFGDRNATATPRMEKQGYTWREV